MIAIAYAHVIFIAGLVLMVAAISRIIAITEDRKHED